MFVCMFQSQLQLQYHTRTVEPSLREKIVKKVGINFFFQNQPIVWKYYVSDSV